MFVKSDFVEALKYRLHYGCLIALKHRRRLEDTIKMDLQEVGSGGMDWIDMAQDRDRWRALVSAVMNLRVPQNAGDFLTR
jgi:hypothetical protein